MATDYRFTGGSRHYTDIWNRVLNSSANAIVVEGLNPLSASVTTLVSANVYTPVTPISATLAAQPISAFITNALSSQVTNALSANIYNALSAQITNALSAQITNALSATVTSVTSTVSANIYNSLSANIYNALSANIYNALSAQITNHPNVKPIADSFVTTDGTNASPFNVTSGAASAVAASGVGLVIRGEVNIRISAVSGMANYFTLPSGTIFTIDTDNMTNVWFRADGVSGALHYMLYS